MHSGIVPSQANMAAAPQASSRRLILADPAATSALAGRLAALARPRDVLALQGPLGAGKTEFARGFIRALAARHGAAPPVEVPSPTFTLVQTYELGPATVWHFDLYRLARAEDAVELGLDDALAEGISLIEWPERLGRLLPRDRLEIELAYGDAPSERRATLMPHGDWRDRLADV